MTLPATLLVPKFLRFERNELQSLYHVLRDPLVTHVYGLLMLHTDFKTGEFLGGYKRLMELCTPPQPERGRRRPGPSYWQLRRVVEDLLTHLSQHYGEDGQPTLRAPLARRDARANAAQGQLRIHLIPREKNDTPKTIAHRVNRRLQKSEKLDSMRLPESPMDELPQGKTQGYQGFNTTSPTPPETASYPPTAAGKKGKSEALALLAALKSSPPNSGGRKGPRVDPDDVPY